MHAVIFNSPDIVPQIHSLSNYIHSKVHPSIHAVTEFSKRFAETSVGLLTPVNCYTAERHAGYSSLSVSRYTPFKNRCVAHDPRKRCDKKSNKKAASSNTSTSRVKQTTITR